MSVKKKKKNLQNDIYFMVFCDTGGSCEVALPLAQQVYSLPCLVYTTVLLQT